jgi:glycosyltransferase involved in cell wall biosynthesis
MRIVFVIPFFAPAWGYGGPPRQTFDLARQLVRRGHSVQVITTDSLDGTSRIPDRFETLDGVAIQRVPNLSNWLAWDHKIFVPVGFGAAFRAALGQAEIVHLFDFRDLQNAVAYMSMRRTGVPFLLSAFGELPRATGPKRWAKYVFDLLWGYRIISQASALVAQTDDEAACYQQFGARAEQVRNIPLAVDLEAIKRASQPGAFRTRIGVAPKELMILFLGRIHEYKGIELLIRAYRRVRAERPDVRLVIAGRDDGFLAAARRLACELVPPGAVIFCGPLYGESRFDAYADADLFALTPSHAEQTSLAALEACACGTPALVTRQAPIPDLDASGAGVTAAYDEEAVADALAGLLNANLKEMGERAAALVRRRFSLPTVAAALEDVYLEVCSDRRPTTPVGV